MIEGGSTKRMQAVSGIVLLVVVVMLMTVYYLWLTSQDDDSDHDTIMVSRSIATPGDQSAYADSESGFSVRGIAGWSIGRSSMVVGGSAIPATVFSKAGESVSVWVVAKNEATRLREVIIVEGETPITVSGIEGVQLQGTIAGGDDPLDLILLNHGGNTYGIAGYGECLQEVLRSFEI